MSWIQSSPTLAVLLGAIVLTASDATAQKALTENTLTLEERAERPRASIEDVAWLTGRWKGEGLGGTLEETWSPPLGRAMVATFRLVADGKPSFYEICLLAEEEGSLVYKVKHFNPDLTGWEEKDDYVTFPLVKIEGDTIWFRGLTLKREGSRCTHYLAMKLKDGSYREATLVYTRADARELELAPEPAPDTDAPREVSLDWLSPLHGQWGPAEAEDRVVHSYEPTVGGQAITLREGFRRGAPEAAELQGLVYADPASGKVRFIAVAGHGEGQGRLFRGEYRRLEDGRIEREYTVDYRTLADTPGEELCGLQRRYREIYSVTSRPSAGRLAAGVRLAATLEWWRDGEWQAFGGGKYSLVRR